MTYEEFINYIRENMEEMLGQGVKTKITKVLKNNNVEMDALSVVNSESHISPVIYLNTYYEEYKEGRGIEEISEEIFSLYEDHKMDLQFDADFFSDFDRIKNRIVYKLINTASNIFIYFTPCIFSSSLIEEISKSFSTFWLSSGFI